MQRRIALVVGLVILIGVLGTVTGQAGNSLDRKPTVTTSAHETKSVAYKSREVRELRRALVRCGRLSCINNALTNLSQAVGNLLHDAFTCEVTTDITQYDGYEYDVAGLTYTTTAIDYTELGDPYTDRMVVYTC